MKFDLCRIFVVSLAELFGFEGPCKVVDLYFSHGPALPLENGIFSYAYGKEAYFAFATAGEPEEYMTKWNLAAPVVASVLRRAETVLGTEKWDKAIVEVDEEDFDSFRIMDREVEVYYRRLWRERKYQTRAAAVTAAILRRLREDGEELHAALTTDRARLDREDFEKLATKTFFAKERINEDLAKSLSLAYIYSHVGIQDQEVWRMLIEFISVEDGSYRHQCAHPMRSRLNWEWTTEMHKELSDESFLNMLTRRSTNDLRSLTKAFLSVEKQYTMLLNVYNYYRCLDNNKASEVKTTVGVCIQKLDDPPPAPPNAQPLPQYSGQGLIIVAPNILQRPVQAPIFLKIFKLRVGIDVQDGVEDMLKAMKSGWEFEKGQKGLVRKHGFTNLPIPIDDFEQTEDFMCSNNEMFEIPSPLLDPVGTTCVKPDEEEEDERDDTTATSEQSETGGRKIDSPLLRALFPNAAALGMRIKELSDQLEAMKTEVESSIAACKGYLKTLEEAKTPEVDEEIISRAEERESEIKQLIARLEEIWGQLDDNSITEAMVTKIDEAERSIVNLDLDRGRHVEAEEKLRELALNVDNLGKDLPMGNAEKDLLLRLVVAVSELLGISDVDLSKEMIIRQTIKVA